MCSYLCSLNMFDVRSPALFIANKTWGRWFHSVKTFSRSTGPSLHLSRAFPFDLTMPHFIPCSFWYIFVYILLLFLDNPPHLLSNLPNTHILYSSTFHVYSNLFLYLSSIPNLWTHWWEKLYQIFIFFFFFFLAMPATCRKKFPVQGLNLHHSSNQSHGIPMEPPGNSKMISNLIHLYPGPGTNWTVSKRRNYYRG